MLDAARLPPHPHVSGSGVYCMILNICHKRGLAAKDVNECLLLLF